MEGFGHHACPHPWLGTSPSATFLLGPWAVVVRATVVGVAGRSRNSSRIGVPGHAFAPIADAGRRRHTQGLKIGLRWLVEVSWVSLLPHLDSGFRRNDDWGPE